MHFKVIQAAGLGLLLQYILIHAHTIKPQQIFPISTYRSLIRLAVPVLASLVEMMLREGGQEELSRGRDLTRLKMATIATMFAKDKLMKQLPLNVV